MALTANQTDDVIALTLFLVMTAGAFVWAYWKEKNEAVVKPKTDKKEKILQGSKNKVFKDRLFLLLFAFITFVLAKCAETTESFSGRSIGEGVNPTENPLLFSFVVKLLYLSCTLFIIVVLLSFFRKKK